MTEPMLDLTIIIPSYNTRDLLHDCIQSVYKHTTGITFEIICLDDNSPDRSADMVAECFPRVILVRNPVNLFYTKNNNLGMRMSRARYACLLNSDTKLIGNAFEALVRFMDAHPDAATCGPKLLNPDMSVQHCIRRFAGVSTFFLQALSWHRLFPNSRLMNRYYTTEFDYSEAQPVESIGTTAYVVRRSTWEQAGMLDERFRLALVDLAYNYILNRKGYKVVLHALRRGHPLRRSEYQPEYPGLASRPAPGPHGLQRTLRLFRQEPCHKAAGPFCSV